VSAYPWGVWYSRNLTPDDETGLGRWTEAEVIAAITRGIARDGRRLDPIAMPWPWFNRLRPEDARAIAAYLRNLPPRRNAVPLPEAVPPGEKVGGKLLALLGGAPAIEVWPGNAGANPALRGHIPAPPGRRPVAALLGWSAFVAGAVLTVAAVFGSRRRSPYTALRRPAFARRRRWFLAAGLALLVVATTLTVWPPLSFLSPEMTVAWLFRGTPALPSSLEGPARALAERGQYVATVAPCGLCHTPAGAFAGFYTGRTMAGGMRATWRVYGSAVSSNLTPHAGDGIAGVSDAALLRAITSGIARDGRAMHWQAMPWDISSNWSEEDLRAMLAYLRALPPVPGRVPPPRPPAAGDPVADTFFFGDAARR
ncbi:MAG: hypothetical protein ACREJG_13940, partial [Candidatus Rokuibacteriota bacterium]